MRGLTAAAIEFAHDVGIDAVWPGVEPVHTASCRDVNLLYSAAEQPFQECFGRELYPTLENKAAYFFCHLVTAHVFENGNKRTAVLCLDSFLLLNLRFLFLGEEELYELAKRVASSGEQGIRFADIVATVTQIIREQSVTFEDVEASNAHLYRQCLLEMQALIEALSNQPGARLMQRDHRV